MSLKYCSWYIVHAFHLDRIIHGFDGSHLQGKGSRVVATMAKKSVGDLSKADLEGKVVFERADLNVSFVLIIYRLSLRTVSWQGICC